MPGQQGVGPAGPGDSELRGGRLTQQQGFFFVCFFMAFYCVLCFVPGGVRRSEPPRAPGLTAEEGEVTAASPKVLG